MPTTKKLRKGQLVRIRNDRDDGWIMAVVTVTTGKGPLSGKSAVGVAPLTTTMYVSLDQIEDNPND